MMNKWELLKHKSLNFIQSIAFMLLMALLLRYLALTLGGTAFAWLAFIGVVLMYAFNKVIAPYVSLFLTRARPLHYHEAPELFNIMRTLAQQAELQHTPRLYYLPTELMNAFAVGRPDNAVIALSDGLLRRLTTTEIAGVLGHEMSHIKNNDMRVMGFAEMSSRLTKILSWLGQLLLMLNLPLVLFGMVKLHWGPILLLIAAPILSDLIQLALSRVREFNADLGSAMLLGNPEPLASALQKMEIYQGTLLDRLFPFRRRETESSLLRTHPPTTERIQRLQQFRETKVYRPENTPLAMKWRVNESW